MKENKGITLVALIITIIVMMILVAVSVAVIINSDLLGTAKNAGESYKAKAGEEGNLSGDDVQIIVGDKTYDSLDEYKQTLCSHESFDIEADDECPDCGAQKITFTIEGLPQVALEGMTWGDWAETGWCWSPDDSLGAIVKNDRIMIVDKISGSDLDYLEVSTDGMITIYYAVPEALINDGMEGTY